MAALRTLRREWKAILSGAFFLGGLLFVFYEIYCAWAYSGMHSLPLLPGLYRLYCKWAIDSGCVGLPAYSDWISFSVHPTLFLINLAVSILITIVVVPLLALGFWGWRAEQRNLQRRESLPPLDTNIRESIDR
jgi:hypothetical protein